MIRSDDPREHTLENPTYIALSRLMAQQRTMDVIANNIANSNTPGFKAEHVLFSDWLLPETGKPEAEGEQTLAFTQDRATWRDQSAGSITHTGDPLDLALGTDGFFSVSTPNGVRLTRSGRFTLKDDGTIVDSDGDALLDSSGSPILLTGSPSSITVAGDGTVSAAGRQVAKIGVVEPSDRNRLFAEGNRLFRADAPTAGVSAPAITQGGVESSNVSPMIEMTRMMQLQRDFQFMTQFAQGEVDRQQNVIEKLAAEPQA